MKILCKSDSSRNLQGGQYVNKVGRYLYDHIDGAFRFEKSPNMYDIWITVLYQAKPETIDDRDDIEVHEMTVDINVTTYQDKLRVNIINQDKYEKTIGTKTFSFEKLNDLEDLKLEILKFVQKKLEKEYKDFEFYF